MYNRIFFFKFSKTTITFCPLNCRNTLIGLNGGGEDCNDPEDKGTDNFGRVADTEIMAGIKEATEGESIWDSNCEVVKVTKSATPIFVDTVATTTPSTTAMQTTTISSSAGPTTTTISSSAGQTTTTMLPAGGNTTVTKMSTTTITTSGSTKSTKKSGSNKMSAGQSVVLIAAEVMALAVGLWFK